MAPRLKLLISSGCRKKEPRYVLVGIMMLFNEVDTVFCDSGIYKQAVLPTFQRNLQPPFAG